MRLELLTHGVALSLDRFAMGSVDPREGRQFAVDRVHDRVGSIEVAGLAGAESAVAIGVGNGRGAATGLDPVDQRGAFIRIQKRATDEQGQVTAGHTLHAGLDRDPGGVGIGRGGRKLGDHGARAYPLTRENQAYRSLS